MNIESHTVEVAGLRTHYRVTGHCTAGVPLILLHGNGDSSSVWRSTLEALAGSYRLYTPDLPGFGESEPPQDYTPSAYARFIEAFLDTLDIERAVVVGNSFGGLIALHLARAVPDRVAALVLVSSAGLGRLITTGWPPLSLPGYGELAISWSKTPLGAAERAWRRAALLPGVPFRAPSDWWLKQYQEAQRSGVMDSALAVVRAQVEVLWQREVWLEELPKLTMPTLIIWGALDRMLPLIQGWMAVQRLPHGVLSVFPDCGHLPHVEQPERFAATLDGFLRRHPSTGAVSG